MIVIHILAVPAGLEPATFGFVIQRSIPVELRDQNKYHITHKTHNKWLVNENISKKN